MSLTCQARSEFIQRSEARNTYDHSRAVIVGGSIAGLSAAAALSPFFQVVTVIERDDIDGHEV